MSVAQLSRNQGRRDEAYDLLAPAYNWFTEGLDTLDLKFFSASWCRFAFWVLRRRAANCVRLRSLTQTRLWLFAAAF
jgi:hypothetical protein